MRRPPSNRTPLRVTIDEFGADALGTPNVRVVREQSVILRGSVGRGAESVQCNNAPAKLSAGRWQCSVVIIDKGQGMGVNIVAEDREGNSGGAYIGIMTDTTPPSVKITSSKREGDSALIEGEAGDNFPLGVSVTVNGVDAPLHNWKFSARVPASNEIQVVARDAVGNTATASLTLPAHRRAPSRRRSAP